MLVLLFALFISGETLAFGQAGVYICTPRDFGGSHRSPMTFEKLKEKTVCLCLDETCREDTVSIFAHGLLAETPTEEDFKTGFEANNEPKQLHGDGTRFPCDVICYKYRSVSINLFNDSTRDAVLERYKATLKNKFRPDAKPKFSHYLLFRLKTDCCGKVRFTDLEYDPTHYDFFKCDDFKLGNLDIQGINSLSAT